MYLLTIRGSAVWRLTTALEPVTVSGAGVFFPGLEDPQPEESADSGAGREVAVKALLPPEAWQALTTQEVAGWSAEIAWIEEGAAYSARQVVVDGRIDSPSYATSGDAVELTVVENPWEDRSIFPFPGQQASASTWPADPGDSTKAFPEGSEGIWYPWVFGSPGVVYSTDTFTEYHGWPAILVEVDATTANNFDTGAIDATVLIAGHKAGFSTVTLYNLTTGQNASVNCATGTDRNGGTVTIARVAGVDLQISDGDELWASAPSISESGVTSDSGRSMRGVGDIVQWLLTKSTIRFDVSMLAQLQRLNAYKADFYVNDPTSAYAIITDLLLAGNLLPAYWQHGEQGYYLAVQPIDPAVIEYTIDTAKGWTRQGSVSVSSSGEVATDFEILYAEDPQTNAKMRRIAYAPTGTTTATGNGYCAGAYAALKRRKSLSIEAPAIQDPTAATLLLDAAVRRNSGTIRVASYAAPGRPPVRVGQAVAVSDAAVNWTAKRCWITAIQRTLSTTTITVETLPERAA